MTFCINAGEKDVLNDPVLKRLENTSQPYSISLKIVFSLCHFLLSMHLKTFTLRLSYLLFTV